MWRMLIHRMIMKKQVKNEQIKRKQTCSLCLLNVFKLQENKFKIVQKNFYEIRDFLSLFLPYVPLLFFLNISSSVPAKLVCFLLGHYPKSWLFRKDCYPFNATRVPTNRSSKS